MTIRELLEGARQMLAGQDAERLESEILLAHVLNQNRAFLYANPEREINPGRLQNSWNWCGAGQPANPSLT